MRKRHIQIAGLLLAAVCAAVVWGHAAQAQTDNLLTNGGLERPYYAQGAATRTAPQGWTLWIGAGSPNALPNNEKNRVREGEVSWKIEQGGAAFTAAAYQRVEGLKAGDAITASASGWVFTCGSTGGCTTTEAPYQRSDTTAGASLKVGIDPTGGTDPASEAIQWSAVAAPYDQWASMSVSATAGGEAATVFLYMTQTTGLTINEVYWDQVALVLGNTPGDGSVPFVAPQGVRPDGSIVHVVQDGDTLSSIAFAYNKDYSVTVVSIADLNDSIKPNTRYLRIGQEIMILPPGSVDPQTGRLLPPEQRPTDVPTEEPTEIATEEPTEAPTEEATAEATEAAAEVATEVPTEEPVATVPSETESLPGGAAVEPTEELQPTPIVLPTVSMVTPSPTPQTVAEAPADEAPVDVPAADNEAAARLISVNGTLCVTVFDDTNVNGVYDEGEPVLSGAQVALLLPDGTQEDHPVEGDSPLCLDTLAGRYDVSARLPDRYGLTTAGSAAVNLASGRDVTVTFGGAAGYAPPAAPVAEPDQTLGETVETGAIAPLVDVNVDSDSDSDKSTFDRIYDNSGLFVLGAAGVFLIGGLILVAGLRRR